MQIVNSRQDYEKLEEGEKTKFKEYIQKSSLKVRVEGDEELTFTAYIDDRLLNKFGIESISFSDEEKRELEEATRLIYESQKEIDETEDDT